MQGAEVTRILAGRLPLPSWTKISKGKRPFPTCGEARRLIAAHDGLLIATRNIMARFPHCQEHDRTG